MRHTDRLRKFVFCACVMALAVQPLLAQKQHASGGGTYFPAAGLLSEFQFDDAHLQCKIGHAVLPGGIQFHMFMASTNISSVSINSGTKTVTIKGTMVSIVVLRFSDGTSATLSETVPFTAVGVDNGTPGAGVDTFSLSVTYVDTPGLDQADLFGTSATFAGTLNSGDIVVQ